MIEFVDFTEAIGILQVRSLSVKFVTQLAFSRSSYEGRGLKFHNTFLYLIGEHSRSSYEGRGLKLLCIIITIIYRVAPRMRGVD